MAAVAIQIRAKNNPVEYFRKDSEIRVATGFLNDHFAGTGSIHIQIDGKQTDALKRPGAARQDPPLPNARGTDAGGGRDPFHCGLSGTHEPRHERRRPRRSTRCRAWTGTRRAGVS